MGKEAFVFEVSRSSFDKYVLFNSHKIPVLVQFMGVWSEPSVIMSDLFAALAKEFPEQFIFAKVDIDEQKELVEEYEIQNIPTLLVFKDGKMVRQEVGQLQEVEARSLLKDFGVFRESDLLREQARDKHLSGDTGSAVMLLTQAIKTDPSNTRIAMDMVQIFLDVGDIAQAQALFERLPDKDKQTEMGKALSGQLTFAGLAAKLDTLEELNQRIADNEADFDARFDLAIKMISLYDYENAMEQLFAIIEAEPDYKAGAAQQMVYTFCNMMAPVNIDMAQLYRRRLANMVSN